MTKELLNQNAVRLRVKDEDVSSQSFLYYRLRCKDFSNFIVSTAQGSANQASITLKDIFGFKFGLPRFEEQEVIADFLSSIDNKIDLNRQINSTLEQIAQILFKHWFIDFEFPDENGILIDQAAAGWLIRNWVRFRRGGKLGAFLIMPIF